MSTPDPHGWRLDQSYARLPAAFFARVDPQPVAAPQLALFNAPLARALGLDADALAQQPALFAGNALPPGSVPIAQAYAGHQFGHFTQLGDGRAVLLGEQLTPEGARVDIQLKGSGRTPYSRRGDGRAALGPMLREYLVSEAMHALGIPTTRSLAVTLTGEPVYRNGREPGAVLTRVAASHVRVGTFEYAAARGDVAALRALADYVIARHYPALAGTDAPYLALLQAVIDRQAALIARWLHVGFIHGVMNTDNMTLCGETIDYGPCAFMDAYDPATVFSSIDEQGRYAFGNQPGIAHWNLARLAESLLPLLADSEPAALELAREAIGNFPAAFRAHWLAGMRGKLGLFTDAADDVELVELLLDCLERTRADYTLSFRTLSPAGLPAGRLADDPAFRDWQQHWRARLARQPQSAREVQQRMDAHNPAFIPRNHRVEEALAAAVDDGDYAPLQRLLAVLARPYDEQPGADDLRGPAGDGNPGYRTYCGT